MLLLLLKLMFVVCCLLLVGGGGGGGGGMARLGWHGVAGLGVGCCRGYGVAAV